MPNKPIDKDEDKNTVDEFLDYLRLSHDHWGEGPPRSGWVFRGIPDADFDLVPSAHRDPAHHSAFFASLYRAKKSEAESAPPEKLTSGLAASNRQIYDKNPDRAREAFIVNAAERWGVLEFLSVADEQGVRIPGEFARIETRSDFEFWPNAERSESMLHPAFALAQHHGCSTRLLDWTWNPLAAAFFAADHVHPNKTDGRLAVWALHVSAFNDGDWRRFDVPAAGVAYLHAQQGLFAFHRNADLQYVMKGRWPRMNDDIPKAKLRRVTLPREMYRYLLHKLYRERISRAHLMPTLDNVTVTLEKMSKI